LIGSKRSIISHGRRIHRCDFRSP